MNTNCLDGMVCPQCGSEGPFEIVATSTFQVDDSGSEHIGDVEWDDDSSCTCCACRHSDVVAGFRDVEEDES